MQELSKPACAFWRMGGAVGVGVAPELEDAVGVGVIHPDALSDDGAGVSPAQPIRASCLPEIASSSSTSSCCRPVPVASFAHPSSAVCN